MDVLKYEKILKKKKHIIKKKKKLKLLLVFYTSFCRKSCKWCVSHFAYPIV